MLHCLNGPATGTDITVLERQRARMKWQPQEQQGYFGGSDQFAGLFLEPGQVGSFQGLLGGESVLGEVLTRSVKPDPGLENGWPELVNMGFTEFDMNCAISRTSSCPPTVAPPPPEAKGKVSPPAEKVSSAVGRESFKKRKADKLQNTKVCVCVCFTMETVKLCKKTKEKASFSFQCVHFFLLLIYCLLTLQSLS